MLSNSQIVSEIENLPTEYVREIIRYIGYLKHKHLQNIPESMIMSESSLSKDWDSPEEDEAWADL